MRNVWNLGPSSGEGGGRNLEVIDFYEIKKTEKPWGFLNILPSIKCLADFYTRHNCNVILGNLFQPYFIHGTFCSIQFILFDDFCATISAVRFHGTFSNCDHRYRFLFVPRGDFTDRVYKFAPVCCEFGEEFSMKVLQPILCDNHFRICRGLFFLHFVIF